MWKKRYLIMSKYWKCKLTANWNKIRISKTFKKIIIQTLTLFKIIVFTWKTCFVRTRIIYNAIIKSAITYGFFIWHASYERSNNIGVTTKTIIKIQHNCFRIISGKFKTMFIEMLKTEIKMIFIQLHMIKLQMNIKSKFEQHEHDALIKNRCDKIKRRFIRTQGRRKRNVDDTFEIKK